MKSVKCSKCDTHFGISFVTATEPLCGNCACKEVAHLRAEVERLQRELNTANGACENWRKHAEKAEAELRAERTSITQSFVHNTMKGWDRLLWGVEMRCASCRPDPIIIGEAWAQAYPRINEPTRALLFTTRITARRWCRMKLTEYAKNHSLADWKLRPVRVRETVEAV